MRTDLLVSVDTGAQDSEQVVQERTLPRLGQSALMEC